MPYYEPSRHLSRWCYTSFVDHPLPFDYTTHKALVYQQERSPTTGKLHWQGYMETFESYTFEQLKDKLSLYDNAIHLESANNPEASIKYCQKKDTRIEGTQFKFHIESDHEPYTIKYYANHTATQYIHFYDLVAVPHIHIHNNMQNEKTWIYHRNNPDILFIK